MLQLFSIIIIIVFVLTFFLNETLVIFIIFPNKRNILRRQFNIKLQLFGSDACDVRKCLSPHVVGLQQDVVCGQRRHLTALHGQDSTLQEGFLCTQNNKKSKGGPGGPQISYANRKSANLRN
jgi:hypothetical protein